MLIWRGLGILAPVVVASVLFPAIVCGASMSERLIIPSIGFGLGLGAFFLYVIGSGLNRRDAEGKRQNNHSLYFIPMHWWSAPTGALGLVMVCMGCLHIGDAPSERNPAFELADDAISANEDDVIATGNSPIAEEAAAEISMRVELLQSLMFTGGDDNRIISMTKDKFLTHVTMNERGVVVLMHVPQLKNYKGSTRDELSRLVFETTVSVLSDRSCHLDAAGIGTEVTVGLRGAILYGASAKGDRTGDAHVWTDSGFRVQRSDFEPWFEAEVPAALHDIAADARCDALAMEEAEDSGLTEDDAQIIVVDGQ